MRLTLDLRPISVAPDLRSSPEAEADWLRSYEPGYRPQPPATPYPLRFTWDSDVGSISGPDADKVQALADRYRGRRVPHRLQPEDWPVTDPLREPVEMAALLGFWWELPPELEALYPAIEDDTPEGAVN